MPKRSDLILIVAATSCAALMLARWISVFRNGPYVYTSGMEEESLYSIWKLLQGGKVYANPFDPPFAQSYFNWLFYGTYGLFSHVILSLFNLESSALPTICRLLTALLTLAAGGVVYALLTPLPLVRRVAGSAIISLNPLVGFWSITTRPDIGALVLDLLGLCFVKKAGRSGSSGSMWLVPALAAFYCAWAFKQTHIAALAATCIYLVFAGKRREAFLLGGGAALAFCATLLLGTAEYRYALLWSQARMGWLPSLAFQNLIRALFKAPLLPFGIIAAIVCARDIRSDLPGLTGLISGLLMLVASSKVGASDNYFFESAAAWSIVCFLSCSQRCLLAGSITQVVAPMLIFAGVSGMLFTKAYPELALLKTRLTSLSGPVVVTTPWANLPWFQSKPPHFIVATTYGTDRSLSRPFAFDGISGMIRTGRIKLLVCPRNEVNKPFDGIIPASLRKIAEDSSWVYFAP